MGQPLNLKGGRFTTGTGLSASILFFVNISTGRWSAISFTITQCASNDTSVDALYTSFYLHGYVDFFIMTEYHTPTSSLLDGAILRIGTAKIRITTCVPRKVH